MFFPALPFLFASLGGGDTGPIEEIVAALTGGDEARALAAFEQLYRRHADLLIAFAASVSGRPGDAVDIVHDVFVALWERRTAWHPDPARGVRAYLYASVRNAARNRARTERRAAARDARAGEALADDAAAAATPDDDGDDELRIVWAALDRLPPLRKQVAMLRWSEGMSPAEIARTLDLTRNAVDQHLYRALQTLRTLLPNRVG